MQGSPLGDRTSNGARGRPSSFDSGFYEWRALWHYARRCGRPVQCNVRLFRAGVPYSRRPEVDGLVIEADHCRAIEVKSTPLRQDHLQAVIAHYRGLGFGRLTVIAPGFESPRVPAELELECVEFSPDTRALVDAYRAPWRPDLALDRWLGGGPSHIRYVCARAGARGSRRVLPQTKQNIRSVAVLQREVARRLLPRHVPVRILWGSVRALFPRDLHDRRRRPYVWQRGLVLDIDGHAVHRAMAPCELDPQTGLCADCIGHARHHTAAVVELLGELGLPAHTFFSGRTGFHVYPLVPVEPALRQRLGEQLVRRRIMVDRQVTEAAVPMSAIPTSIHGYTNRRLVRVPEPLAFSPTHSPCLGGP